MQSKKRYNAKILQNKNEGKYKTMLQKIGCLPPQITMANAVMFVRVKLLLVVPNWGIISYAAGSIRESEIQVGKSFL
jgi:hypothetical protein